MVVIDIQDIKNLSRRQQRKVLPGHFELLGLDLQGANYIIELKEFIIRPLGDRSRRGLGVDNSPKNKRTIRKNVRALKIGIIDPSISLLEERLRAFSDFNPDWNITANRGDLRSFIDQFKAALKPANSDGVFMIRKELIE